MAILKPSPFTSPTRYRNTSHLAGGSWVLNVLAAIGAMLAIALLTPAVVWYSQALAHPWETGTHGTLVVLSGADTGGAPGTLGDSTYWSALYAVRTWREGNFDRVLIVGAPCAREISLFMKGSGVPESRIMIDELPASTHEAAIAVARLSPHLAGPLVLLTSDFHIPLAAASFHKAGLHPVIAPFPDGIKRGQQHFWYKRLSVLGDLTEETGELVRYWWRGWI